MIRLLLALTLLSLAASAAADELYKWTDEQGQVHYTDQPPPDKAFEKREIKPAPPAPAPSPAAAPTAAPAKGSPGCEQAKANLAVFEKSQNVEMDLDGDGKTEALDAAQRERELQRTRDLIKALCTS